MPLAVILSLAGVNLKSKSELIIYHSELGMLLHERHSSFAFRSILLLELSFLLLCFSCALY
jgi:hypothetical protein